MLKKLKYPLMAIAVLILAGGIWFMHNNLNLVSYTAEQINADNSLINGKILTGRGYVGLRLADITFKNTTFSNINIAESDFRNVTFENCTFSKTRIVRSRFENVIFKDCLLTHSGTPVQEANRTIIWSSTFNNVAFDNVKMQSARLIGVSGSLTFRNMRDFSNYRWGDYRGGPIVTDGNSSVNINFRVDNCELSGAVLAVLSYDSTVYITNSRLKESGFSSSPCKIIYAENCILEDTDLGEPQLLVVKDSTVQVSTTGVEAGQVYFVNNKYIPRTVLAGREVHVWGGGARGDLTVTGGNVFIYDMELTNFYLVVTRNDKIESVNLRNVKIVGGIWADLRLESGMWENVEIYPSIEIEHYKFKSDPEIKSLKVHNVTLPQGNPFIDKNGAPGNVNAQGQKSDRPFEWPEVHVPTAQELGLID
jgi:uncharacterized protein YjbI with pentapeptide repeats